MPRAAITRQAARTSSSRRASWSTFLGIVGDSRSRPSGRRIELVHSHIPFLFPYTCCSGAVGSRWRPAKIAGSATSGTATARTIPRRQPPASTSGPARAALALTPPITASSSQVNVSVPVPGGIVSSATRLRRVTIGAAKVPARTARRTRTTDPGASRSGAIQRLQDGEPQAGLAQVAEARADDAEDDRPDHRAERDRGGEEAAERGRAVVGAEGRQGNVKRAEAGADRDPGEDDEADHGRGEGAGPRVVLGRGGLLPAHHRHQQEPGGA